MIGAFGLALTLVGAGSALLGAVAASLALYGRVDRTAATRFAWCAFGGLLAANLVMVAALVSHDFSIAYVAQVGSRATPLLYTVASLWGALEGSILFWAGLLSAVTVLLARRVQGGPDEVRLPGALAVLLSLVAFFGLITVGPGNPWQRINPVPLDGPGPNPLLQDHPLMALHPPLLYLGFVGLAVPFALTVDALLRGRLDEGWLRLARRWTLGPWALLTLGLFAGAWWSYAVLGWGGYWAWDPVENVALLPWLTATAFLHSAMVGRRGGLLVSWNVGLVTASFALTLFATLVTRSGVLDSVHAFTRSAIGPLFVGLLGCVLVGMVALLAIRLPAAEGQGRLGARGQAFLLNNLLLVVATATVIVGTTFPLLAEAAASARLSVGAPYFERVIGPLALGILALMGIGPSLPWGSWSSIRRESLVPGAVAAAAAAVASAVTGSDPVVVVGTATGFFALTQSLVLITRRIRRGVKRDASDRGRGRRTSLRVLGGLVSHAGIALLALAVIASLSGRREDVLTLPSGASADALGRTVEFVGSDVRPGPNRMVITARVRVSEGTSSAELSPSLSVFGSSTQAIASPAIIPSAVDDLYLTLLDLDAGSGVATVRIGLHPFVSWIWGAGALIALGGGLAFIGRPLSRRPVVPAGDAKASTAAGDAHVLIG